MKTVCLFLLVAVAVVLAAPRPETSTFTTKYDNINIEEILKNERLRDSYYLCLMGEKKCTQEGKELKAAIPKAIQTKCEGCNEKQKAATERVIKWFMVNDQKKYKAIIEKYDKDGSYRKEFAELAKEHGITF